MFHSGVISICNEGKLINKINGCVRYKWWIVSFTRRVVGVVEEVRWAEVLEGPVVGRMGAGQAGMLLVVRRRGVTLAERHHRVGNRATLVGNRRKVGGLEDIRLVQGMVMLWVEVGVGKLAQVLAAGTQGAGVAKTQVVEVAAAETQVAAAGKTRVVAAAAARIRVVVAAARLVLAAGAAGAVASGIYKCPGPVTPKGPK